jgi:hypothetical protein
MNNTGISPNTTNHKGADTMELLRTNEVEQIRNMELLVEALRSRGYLIRYLGNRLILQPGSGKWELDLMKRMFEELQIEAKFSSEDTVIVGDFHFTEDMAELVSMYRAFNQESWCPQHMRSWKTFVKRRHGYKLDTLTLDAGIAYMVKMLSKAGILTEMSCDGHGRKAPTIWFAGAWNAAWFEVVSGKLLEGGGELHYRWVVEEEARGHILTAKKVSTGKWSLKHIQEDTMRIGAYLDKHAEELSCSKRKYFKYRSMKAQADLLSQDYEMLKMWMLEKVAR